MTKAITASGAVPSLLHRLVEEDAIPAGVVTYQTRTGSRLSCHAGRISCGGRPVSGDDRFLVASLTKPVVAAGVLLLVQRGEIALGDRVVSLLPEFSGGTRRPITVRHLLTHTSGLPEVWAENRELRAAHASLDDFVDASCRAELAHRVGAVALYSSVGYSLLGAIVERVTGVSLKAFLAREVFEPLAMSRTSMGIDTEEQADDVAEIRLPQEQLETDCHWNSWYWRRLGAPWGGLVSTADDLITFLRAFAGWDNDGLFSSVVRDASWTNQLLEIVGDTETSRRRGWGLGWRMNWPGHAAALCELQPASVVGHYGATGTLMWVGRDAAAVMLTTQPALGRPAALQRLSNVVAAAT